MKVTVYFSPSDAKEGVFRKATVVLVDVLRMTSTVATYLSHGADAVAILPDPALAKAAFAKYKRGEGLLAGETHWEKLAGFPMSGSPLDSSRDKVKGRTICLSTRSALALKPLKSAETLLLGAFVNLSDVYDTVLRFKKDVVVVCGVSEHGNVPEDIVFAGMLCDFLQNTVGSEVVVLAESAKKAIQFYKPWQGRLHELLQGSPEGKEIAQKGFEKDLSFCARMNRVDGVPILRNGLFVRESAAKPRTKSLAALKAEAAAPAKGKAIKVHVPLFPKNPEHPTPELSPRKQAAAIAAAPAKGGAKTPPVKNLPPAKGTLGKASVKPVATVKSAKPGKPGTTVAKGTVSVAKGLPVSGVKPPEKVSTKPVPRKTPLFSKRTVAVPYMDLKPVEPSVAVSHAMDALKASLAHLKDRKAGKAALVKAPASAKAAAVQPAGKPSVKPTVKPALSAKPSGKPVAPAKKTVKPTAKKK